MWYNNKRKLAAIASVHAVSNYTVSAFRSKCTALKTVIAIVAAITIKIKRSIDRQSLRLWLGMLTLSLMGLSIRWKKRGRTFWKAKGLVLAFNLRRWRKDVNVRRQNALRNIVTATWSGYDAQYFAVVRGVTTNSRTWL